MTIEITVPELGESVLEATVSRWLKKEGDFVNVGEVLVELETDKVNLEVGAKGNGVLQKIEAPEGADVKVGNLLGIIDEKATAGQNAAPPTPSQPVAEVQKPEPAPVETKQAETPVATPAASAHSDGQQMERETALQISPVAARLARDKNVDISKIAGTGSEGRVTKADVEMYLQQQATTQVTEQQRPLAPEREGEPAPSPSVSPSGPREERTRMSRRRRTIAQRLLEASQTTAMLTTFNEIDMSMVMDIRKRRNEEFQKRFGIKLGFTSFFVKAAISALKAFPQVNAEIDGEEIVFKHYYDIGMAVGSAEAWWYRSSKMRIIFLLQKSNNA